MSKTTRCPNCQTVFRVTDEQLGAYQGKVRCGRCANVFDGAVHLMPVPDKLPDLAEEPTNRQETLPGPAENEPPVELVTEVVQPTEPEAIEAAPAPAVEASLPPAPAMRKRAVSGIRQAPKKKPASGALRKFGRFMVFLFSLIFLLLLAAQILYYFRTQIIVAYPPAKPLFQTLCAKLKCQLPLPRQIDLLDIESSDLQADAARPGVVTLNATLRNRASFNQAYPTLELNLFDLQGQLVARRLLAPREYVRKTASLPTGIEPNGEIEVRVGLDNSALKYVGYRLNVLYP